MALPPVLLAVAGLTHPMDLSRATSHHWLVLHVVLIPVFPLLGVGLWVLLRGERGPVAGVARVAAFVYACFYSALDTVNGVAVGMVLWRTPSDQATDPVAGLRPLLDLGNALGWVGSWAYLLGAALTSALLIRRRGRQALPGAVLTIAASVSFLDSHIYWPRGVLTMVVLAAGLVLLTRGQRPASAAGSAWAGRRPAAAQQG